MLTICLLIFTLQTIVRVTSFAFSVNTALESHFRSFVYLLFTLCLPFAYLLFSLVYIYLNDRQPIPFPFDASFREEGILTPSK